MTSEIIGRREGFELVIYLAGHRSIELGRLRGARPTGVIVDLEDSVPDEQKDGARQALRTHLSGSRLADHVAIRINDPHSEDGRLDLDMAAACRNWDALVLPKCRSENEIATVARALGPESSAEIWIMIENRAAVSRIAAMAAGSSRVSTLVIGYKDLALDLGVAFDPAAAPLRKQARCIVEAGRNAGMRVLDGVTVGPTSQIAEAAVRASRAGYTGCTFYSFSGVAAARERVADDIAI